ncbi:MAG: GYD domain-containing protein [Betaproteobacteria bacterium]|nr:GYD domain-containing protein [Betaproteobacteria bacterium]
MSTYILLLNYTEQGIRTIKDSPKRVNAARELARKYGAELKDFYLTMGAYDVVSIVEAPTDDAAAKFVLALGALGNVRSTTLKAFTETEYQKIVGGL